MSDNVTFRDFAAALMSNDRARAAGVLSALLGVEPAGAERATAFFHEQMTSSPAFMQEAMSMRAAVEARDEARLSELITTCFQLPDAASAAAHLLSRYPS